MQYPVQNMAYRTLFIPRLHTGLQKQSFLIFWEDLFEKRIDFAHFLLPYINQRIFKGFLLPFIKAMHIFFGKIL